MFLQNDLCEIKILIDESYTVDSADNKYYDIVLNPSNYRRSDIYKTFAIHINLFTEELIIALVGNFYTYESKCAVLDKSTLTVLQGDTITQINILDGSIILHKQFDCFGCNFEIHKIEKGYIIYGEMQITMLDWNFDKTWDFFGKDIFVSMDICEKSIKLYDFEENFYEIDFNGKEIISIPD